MRRRQIIGGVFAFLVVATTVVPSLAQNERVSANGAWLGVELENAYRSGARIVSVLRDGPGSRMGLRAGDLITEIHRVVVRRSSNGRLETRTYPLIVQDAPHLIETLATFRPGQRAMLNVVRNGKDKFIMGALAARPSAQPPPRRAVRPPPRRSPPRSTVVNNPDDLPDLPPLD